MYDNIWICSTIETNQSYKKIERDLTARHIICRWLSASSVLLRQVISLSATTAAKLSQPECHPIIDICWYTKLVHNSIPNSCKLNSFSQAHQLLINKPQYPIGSCKLNGFSQAQWLLIGILINRHINTGRVEVSIWHNTYYIELHHGESVFSQKNNKKCYWLFIIVITYWHSYKYTVWELQYVFANIYTYFPPQIVFSVTSHDPDLSVAKTRSMTTLSSPEILYIIHGNGHFSQAVCDTSFSLWQWTV